MVFIVKRVTIWFLCWTWSGILLILLVKMKNKLKHLLYRVCFFTI